MKKLSKTCSWCSKETSDGFKSKLSENAVICRGCHYVAAMHLSLIPQSSIYCFKCKSQDGFSITVKGGKAEFRLAGEDHEQLPLYVVTKVKGEWTRIMPPISVHCHKCSASIPTKAVYQNKWTSPLS